MPDYIGTEISISYIYVGTIFFSLFFKFWVLNILMFFMIKIRDLYDCTVKHIIAKVIIQNNFFCQSK